MSEKAATRDAYGKMLVELGKELPNLIVMDADLSASTRTAWFAKEYPNRFFNAGVAEQDMMGTAAGLAISGKVVFASTFAIFASGRAWEQVRTSISYPRQNVKVVATHGGITVGEDGVTHQANEDIAIMRAIPNLVTIVPADAIETKKVIRKIANTSGPFYVRLSRSATPVILNEDYEFEIGKGHILKEGKDITLIGCGIMVSECLEAAKELEKEGLSARVVNISTIKPIDRELIGKCAKETGAIVTAEEHSIIGGLGSAVAEVLLEECPVPMKRIGVQDTFCESGKPAELLARYNLTAKDIAETARETIKRK